ncbi:MAG: hypothetical protein KIS87_00385 [Phycisphaeraceae bacterium]|nr:hypothetical protein [Phycisphaeraceae bacterium]
MKTPSSGGYSADVRLHLRINGDFIPLAQIGPDDVVLREPATIPPGPGEVIMHVDGRERRWTVTIGIAAPGSRVIPTAPAH